MDSSGTHTPNFAEIEERAKAYNEAPLKPWQAAQIRRSEKTNVRRQPVVDYRLSDIEWLGKVFDYFIEYDKCDESMEQIRSAKKQFLGAVEHEDVSPFVAFKKAISTTSVAQHLNTLYASQGGMDFYILNHLPISHDTSRYFAASQAAKKRADRRRNVEEIKSLMAKDKVVKTSGGRATKALQAADGAGQGHEGEVEQSEIPQNLEKVVNSNDETHLS